MKKTKNLKKPLLFALSLLPVAIIGGIFTALYMFDTLSAQALSEAVSQVGSKAILVVITVIQTVMYALVCGFFGYIITKKIGLHKPFTLKKECVLSSLIVGTFTGVLLGIDHFISGALHPEIQTANLSSFTVRGIMASIFYGGIIEEVMIRLFFMSLLTLIVWKLFFRKYNENNIPQKVYIIANIVAAIAFAAGHLPATIVMFGELTPFIIIRCFVLNGVAGYLFGELFRKHGIGYAMIAHATAHIAKFIIFAIFI